MHPTFFAESGAKKAAHTQRTTVNADGETVKLLAFDDPVCFNHNLLMTKALCAHQIPLSVVESPYIRAWVESLNPLARPACYESVVEIQEAQRDAQKEETVQWFKLRREEGHKMGGQFDMWRRHGVDFAAYNCTYLALTSELTVGGLVPKWEVRTALLDFAVFNVSHTATNIKDFLDRTNASYELTWDDFNLVAGDGASNNVATFGLLAKDDPAPDTTICYCHDLARAILFILGFGAALDDDDREATAEMTATMKKMRTLAVKFNNVSKLKTALHDAQEADGIQRELDTIKSAITRWNGHYLGLKRNIQLKHPITHVLETATTMNVMTFDEDGEVRMQSKQCSEITPTTTEWALAAEATVVLEPAYNATQLLQGVKTCPPNKAWVVVFNLHKYCAEAPTKTFRIPQPAAPGTTALTFVTRAYQYLHPATKRMISLLERQLFNRFIADGPNKTHMLAMQLDKSIAWPPVCLTSDQVAVAEAHMVVACDVAGGPAAAAAAGPEVVAAEAAVDETACDLLACDAVDPGAFATEEAVSTTEEYKWSHMSRDDYNVGVVQLYGGTATKQTVYPRAFDAMFFWADSRMMKKFPVRGCVFKNNFAAVGAESTSECTFSEAGRAYSKGRTDLDPKQLCTGIVCNSGEKRRATTAPEVFVQYKKRKAVAVAERAAGRAAGRAAEDVERRAAGAAGAATAGAAQALAVGVAVGAAVQVVAEAVVAAV